MKGTVNESSLLNPLMEGSDRVERSPAWEMGDELRWTAANLAYRAAKDYEAALRRIELQLVAATHSKRRFGPAVSDVALDVIRTHMVRGLMHAQLEAGEHMTGALSGMGNDGRRTDGEGDPLRPGLRGSMPSRAHVHPRPESRRTLPGV